MNCEEQRPRNDPAEVLRGLASVFSGPGATVLNVASGRVLVAQGQEVQSVYRIDRGYVRTCVYAQDGTRRIVSFCGPEAIVGVGQLNRPQWTVSVEAVTQCVVTSAPKALVNRNIETDAWVRDGAMLALQSEIEQGEAHLVMMGILPSTERVLAFLSAFAQTRSGNGFLVIPMCRRDIGDYLGLSMETVSRSFTALREAGRIELRGAEKFRLVDAPAPAVSDRAA